MPERAFSNSSNEEEFDSSTWRSRNGSLLQLSTHSLNFIPESSLNENLQSSESIHSELAKLWTSPNASSIADFPGTRKNQRSKTLSADSLWLQAPLTPDSNYSTTSAQNTFQASVPNWAEIAQQRPSSSSGSAYQSFPAGSLGNRHMRMSTAPEDSFSAPFTNDSDRRQRTLSGPPSSSKSSASLYSNENNLQYSSHYLNANLSYTGGYYANQPSHTHYSAGFQPLDSPAFRSSAGQPLMNETQEGINNQWIRRKSVSDSPHRSIAGVPSASQPPYFEKAGQVASSSHASFRPLSNTRKFSFELSTAKRPSFPSTPNRFVSRQLKQGSRDAMDSVNIRSTNKPNPIGIFIWGFPDAIRVKDIIATFSVFGEMTNVGIDIKNGIKFSFIDFDSVYCVQEAYTRIPHGRYLGMKEPLQVRLRFDKMSKPSFDDQGALASSFSHTNDGLEQLDKKTIHLYNLPHNINKPEIEQTLSQIAPISRIKIFQRAVEKKSSVFVTFKSIDRARSAAAFMKKNNLAFKDMKEPLAVEYPTQDISRHPPVFATDPNAVPSLSKKARKMLAANNTIAYARSPDPFVAEALQSALSIHGPCIVYIIRENSPSTAFIKFQTPKACSEALAAKTCGVTLPRHKRVDIQRILDEEKIRDYLLGVADIKAITYSDSVTTIEYLTAIGAAQGIVRFESVPFDGTIVRADYSPSLLLEKIESDGGDAQGNACAHFSHSGSDSETSSALPDTNAAQEV